MIHRNPSEDSLRSEIVETCRRMHQQGLIAGSDGNVSVRLGRDQLLTTPSGVHKGYLTPEDLVKTDSQGHPLGGLRKGKPSSELRLHLLVYELRPDVHAVVHAHPPHAVALSLAGVELAGCLLPETVLSLGSTPTAPYATPTTQEVPDSVRPLLAHAQAIILARHGTMTLGENLRQAWFRLESLEHTARITALARAIGPVEPLGPAQMARLQARARELGIDVTVHCTGCGTCGAPSTSPAPPPVPEQQLMEDLTARVLRRLGR